MKSLLFFAVFLMLLGGCGGIDYTDESMQTAASTKITALSADATPSSDDLIVTVNDPGGSPANKKVTLANLKKGLGLLGTDVEIGEIGTATYDDFQDWLNVNQSAGVADGCEITENAAHDNTIDISAGQIYIKTTDSDIGDIKAYDIAASSGVLSMVAGLNIIYIDYNAGSPIFAQNTDESLLDLRTEAVIGRVFRYNGYMSVMNGGLRIPNPIKRLIESRKRMYGMQRECGVVTSLTNLNVATTAGVFWRGINKFTPVAMDNTAKYAITAVNAGTKTFTISGDHAADFAYSQNIYINGSTGNDKGYHVVSATYGAPNTAVVVSEVVPSAVADGDIHYQTFVYMYKKNGSWDLADFANISIDNLQYNDVSVPASEDLATLGNNQYGVHWLYTDFAGTVLVLYGTGTYTLADAEAATIPSSVPDWLAHFAILAAKVVVKKSAATATVTTAWEETFAKSTVLLHNDSGGLQGGAAGEYYHITSAEHVELHAWLDDVTLGATGDTVTTGKVAGATYGSDGTVTDAELLYINSLSSNAQTQLAAKAATADVDVEMLNDVTGEGTLGWGLRDDGDGTYSFVSMDTLLDNITLTLTGGTWNLTNVDVTLGSLTLPDDNIAVAKIANGDWGDFTCTTNVFALDADVVAAAEMADADHGDITWSSGSATLDADVVAAAEMADADHGDISWTTGVAKIEGISNSAADTALGAAGNLHLNTTDEQLSFHSAADGEISGEASISLIYHRMWSFDPDAICDGAVDRLFLMTVGDDAPEGITIDEWKCSFEADPTTEADLDLKRADAFIGVANAAVVDVLDTTTGTSSEDTDASINAGAVVANGKVLYLEFGTAYTETTHQIIFEFWYHLEED